MLNAPFADGRGRQVAYYSPPPSLFFRQEQLNQSFPFLEPPKNGMGQGLWGLGNGVSFPTPAVLPDSFGPKSPEQKTGLPINRPLTPQSEAFLKQQQKIWEQFEKNRKEALKKAEADVKADKKQAQSEGKDPIGQILESGNGKRPEVGKNTKNKQEPQKTEKEGGFKGSASTLIGAFKVGSALIITGGINAFLFGVPLKTAALVSGVVAGSQSLTALKIHRENNELSRKIIGFTRKLMGRENDLTPSGKEWSMVPVWGTVCGMFGLTEALGNHMYTKITKTPPKTLTQRFDALTEEVRELDAKKATGLSAEFRRFQLDNMKRGKALINALENKAKVYANLDGNTLLKTGGNLADKALKRARRFSEKSAGGRNPLLGYIWSFSMASLGGAAQTVIAAMMQTKVDKAHGLK